MTLIPNWRAVLQKAWSIRLFAIAGLLSGLELVVPDWGHPGLTVATVMAALVARFVAQKGITNGLG